jgi:hypothetical protein
MGSISLSFSDLSEKNPSVAYVLYRNPQAVSGDKAKKAAVDFFSGEMDFNKKSFDSFNLSQNSTHYVTRIPEAKKVDAYGLLTTPFISSGLMPIQMQISNESQQAIFIFVNSGPNHSGVQPYKFLVANKFFVKPFQKKEVKLELLNGISFILSRAQLEDIFVLALAPGPALYTAKIEIDVLNNTVKDLRNIITAKFNLGDKLKKNWIKLSNYLVYTTLEKSTDKSITPRDPYQSREGRSVDYEKYAAIYGSKSKYELNPGSWADMIPAKFASIDVSQIKGMGDDNRLLSQYGVSNKGIILCSVGLVPSNKPLFDSADIIAMLSDVLA